MNKKTFEDMTDDFALTDSAHPKKTLSAQSEVNINIEDTSAIDQNHSEGPKITVPILHEIAQYLEAAYWAANRNTQNSVEKDKATLASSRLGRVHPDLNNQQQMAWFGHECSFHYNVLRGPRKKTINYEIERAILDVIEVLLDELLKQPKEMTESLDFNLERKKIRELQFTLERSLDRINW